MGRTRRSAVAGSPIQKTATDHALRGIHHLKVSKDSKDGFRSLSSRGTLVGRVFDFKGYGRATFRSRCFPFLTHFANVCRDEPFFLCSRSTSVVQESGMAGPTPTRALVDTHDATTEEDASPSRMRKYARRTYLETSCAYARPTPPTLYTDDPRPSRCDSYRTFP